MSNLEYKEKYLKYKKYIDLKKSMKGGMQAATPAAGPQGAAGTQVASIDPNNLLITWYQKASYKKPDVGNRFTFDIEVAYRYKSRNWRSERRLSSQAIKIITPFLIITLVGVLVNIG